MNKKLKEINFKLLGCLVAALFFWAWIIVNNWFIMAASIVFILGALVIMSLEKEDRKAEDNKGLNS